jgi:hypothetical protein
VVHTRSLQITRLCAIFSVAVPLCDVTRKMGKGNFEMCFVLATSLSLNVPHQARVMFHTSWQHNTIVCTGLHYSQSRLAALPAAVARVTRSYRHHVGKLYDQLVMCEPTEKRVAC